MCSQKQNNMIESFFNALLEIVNEMSPYLLLGFFIAGIMHAFIPSGWFNKYLSGRSIRSVIYAAIFGVPLPLCSCGVIPTAMSLRREGASKGATTSFLIATPQTGVDSIIATFSLMGLPFAIIRPIAALFTAIFGGALVNAFDNSNDGTRDKNKNDDSQSETHTGCCSGNAETHKVNFLEKMKEALMFGFVEMMEDIGKWLVVGLLIAGIITAVVPDSWFAMFKDNTVMSMFLVLCISIPMYVCATGSIPIAVALVMKGLTPGSALVLLMAGPAVNAASMLVINKVLGRKTLMLYLMAIISGALGFGVGIDYLLPREWFISALSATDACCHEGASLFEWSCTVLFIALLLNILRMRLQHKQICSCHDDHCHCHDNRDEHCHKDENKHCHCHEDSCTEDVRLTFSVKGMNCNHCCANVKKAVSSVDGVVNVNVDLHSGIMVVEGESLNSKNIMEAVTSIGFDIEQK